MHSRATIPNRTCRVLGLLLLLLPFVPIQAFFGDIKGIENPATAAQWLLGITSVGFTALLLYWLCPQSLARRIHHLSQTTASQLASLSAIRLFIALAITLFLVSHFAYHHKPHLIDSIIQYFQAKILLTGSLKAPLPPEPAFFMTQHMIFHSSGWYGQYPVLQSVLFAVGELVQFPWLSQWILATATVILNYYFTKSAFDTRTANATIILYLFSPFFLFMSGSFMNHVPTLFFISAFLFLFQRWEQHDSRIALAGAGSMIAAAFLIRPLTALAFGLYFGFLACRILFRRRDLLAAAFGLSGFCALAWIFPLYNHATNGSWSLTGYIALWGQSHALGFHESPWGDWHTPLHGLRNELIDITLLNEYLFESLVPGLLPIALYFSIRSTITTWDRRLLIAFFATPCAYFFYWHRDAFLGPRFLYETLACLMPLTAHALVSGISSMRERYIGSDSFFKRIHLSSFVSLILFLTFVYVLVIGIPQRFTIDATSLLTMKRSITEQARQAGITHGLIFVKVSWGNRLLARLRGRGISASQAQRAYTLADHCQLEELLSENVPVDVMDSRIEEFISVVRSTDPKEMVPVNRDPTQRLLKGYPVTRRCIEELRYDQTPYTVYLNALVENRPTLDGPFVVARDLHHENTRLQKRYSEYPAYLYNGNGFTTLP